MGPVTVSRISYTPEVLKVKAGSFTTPKVIQGPPFRRKSHDQPVIEPIEVSVNWTIRGTGPETGNAEKSATGPGPGGITPLAVRVFPAEAGLRRKAVATSSTGMITAA
jgi:hypothetical protein